MNNSHSLSDNGTPLLLTSDFKSHMLVHYKNRMKNVVELGKKYSEEYFFVRNQLRMWEKTFGGQMSTQI
jgi:hypothetical protein